MSGDLPDLSGRIAVVTGAGSGLGAAMCRRFAAAGMTIAALDIDEAGARTTATETADEFGVATLSARVDVGDIASLASAAAQSRRHSGAVTCSARTWACSSSGRSIA